jgi:hypothetical protein
MSERMARQILVFVTLMLISCGLFMAAIWPWFLPFEPVGWLIIIVAFFVNVAFSAKIAQTVD